MNALDEASAQQSAAAAERVETRTSQRWEKTDAITTHRETTRDDRTCL
jgi:hypothetical protein